METYENVFKFMVTFWGLGFVFHMGMHFVGVYLGGIKWFAKDISGL